MPTSPNNGLQYDATAPFLEIMRLAKKLPVPESMPLVLTFQEEGVSDETRGSIKDLLESFRPEDLIASPEIPRAVLPEKTVFIPSHFDTHPPKQED